MTNDERALNAKQVMFQPLRFLKMKCFPKIYIFLFLSLSQLERLQNIAALDEKRVVEVLTKFPQQGEHKGLL